MVGSIVDTRDKNEFLSHILLILAKRLVTWISYAILHLENNALRLSENLYFEYFLSRSNHGGPYSRHWTRESV